MNEFQKAIYLMLRGTIESISSWIVPHPYACDTHAARHTLLYSTVLYCTVLYTQSGRHLGTVLTNEMRSYMNPPGNQSISPYHSHHH
jgi:hypothetical protein